MLMKQNEIVVDTQIIPELRSISLAEGALDLVEQAFLMPGAEERYQLWLSERNRRKEVQSGY